MIRLLVFLIILLCLGLVGAWIAENPGEVTLFWFDYRIDTSLAFLLAVWLLGALALAYFYLVFRAFALFPSWFSERRGIRHHRKGLTELTYAVAALAAQDIKTAEIHNKKAQKLLGAAPLTLLISAQIAKHYGNEEETRARLTELLSYKETEYLAARSLSEAASKQAQLPKALELAERAQRANPKESAAGAAIIGLHLRAGAWQETLLAIDKAARDGRWKRARIHYYKGLMHLKQARALQDTGNLAAALTHARMAEKLLPGFAPAIVQEAELLQAGGERDAALKLILKHWKHAAHPQIAAAFYAALAGLPLEKQQKLKKKLLSIAPEPVAPDALWTCRSCNHATAHWDTHCPACQAFDTLVWK
jgi:HemY protein